MSFSDNRNYVDTEGETRNQTPKRKNKNNVQRERRSDREKRRGEQNPFSLEKEEV